MAAAGCGSEASSETEAERASSPGRADSYALAHGEPIQDCLIGIGVQTAVAPRDISFYWKARREGKVAEIGSAYDEQEDVVVRLLAPKPGGAERWMLWSSQPSSSSRGLDDIIRLRERWYTLPEDDPKKTHGRYLERNFVSYTLEPDTSFLKASRRCVRFPLQVG